MFFFIFLNNSSQNSIFDRKNFYVTGSENKRGNEHAF